MNTRRHNLHLRAIGDRGDDINFVSGNCARRGKITQEDIRDIEANVKQIIALLHYFKGIV